MRNKIAIALFAVALDSFICYTWLFLAYFSSRSGQPNLTLGRIYPLSNHGAFVYLTDVESTEMGFLIALFVASFLLSFVVVPKGLTNVNPSTPRWMRNFAVHYKTDLDKPTRDLWGIFYSSCALGLFVIYFGGRSIATYAVSRGLLLPWFQ